MATMMEGLDTLPPDQHAQLHADIAKLKANRQGIIVGQNHLRATNKRVGEQFKADGHEHLEGARPGVRDRRGLSAGTLRHHGRLQPRLFSTMPWTPIPNPQRPETPLGRAEPDADAAEGARLGGVQAPGRADRELAGVEQPGGPVRDDVVGHLFDARAVPRSDLGHSLAAGPGLSGDDPAGDRQRHQHQRAGTPAGTGRAEGARLPALSTAGAGAGRIAAVGRRCRRDQRRADATA